MIFVVGGGSANTNELFMRILLFFVCMPMEDVPVPARSCPGVWFTSNASMPAEEDSVRNIDHRDEKRLGIITETPLPRELILLG